MSAGSISVLEVDAEERQLGQAKKQILLNAFDMSTIGHLSPGQWKVVMLIPSKLLTL
jgi:hypothetical protein